MRVLRLIIVAALISLNTESAHAEVLIWDFSIDETQVKNGTEIDGSTNSPGIGTGHIVYDTNTNVVSYKLTWNNLFGALTKLHIHGPATASQSNSQHLIEIFGPPDIPAPVDLHSDIWIDSRQLEELTQAGTNPATGLPYDSVSPATIVSIMESGQAYINVHTTVFGTGEIRGNLLLPTIAPEPSALCLMLCGGLWMCSQRTRSFP